jgi:hypothetical protein
MYCNINKLHIACCWHSPCFIAVSNQIVHTWVFYMTSFVRLVTYHIHPSKGRLRLEKTLRIASTLMEVEDGRKESTGKDSR